MRDGDTQNLNGVVENGVLYAFFPASSWSRAICLIPQCFQYYLPSSLGHVFDALCPIVEK